ncbi:ATP-binding protein [Dactylosporangium sp. NPDC050688]|uniref:sensor histidine kinase n=1 Tax=Dactylosporangium sp. NPDC050688 TaxID=3157217 RepID=UPI0033DBA019
MTFEATARESESTDEVWLKHGGASPDYAVIGAALSRAILIIRAAVTVTAASAGVLLVPHPHKLVFLILCVVLATVVEIDMMSWWPRLQRMPFTMSILDTLGIIGALAAGGTSVAYFCYAAGCAAVSGALLRLRAVPIWIAQATISYVAAIHFLTEFRLPAQVQVFVLACPMAGVVCGIGGAIARATVDRHIQSVIDLVNVAQRSAAASERARLARELHDSLTKTLRGVSFAALALPTSLRRHPELAEELASTVSAGVEAAAEQARGLVTGLRLDQPQQPFGKVVEATSQDWSRSTGTAVDLQLQQAEPTIAVRYELLRILSEALTNVERHAGAHHVRIQVQQYRGTIRLVVADDGRGLPHQPPGPSEGHFGIVGMSERARAIGGALSVRSSPDGGTWVTVTAPIRLADEVPESQEAAGV